MRRYTYDLARSLTDKKLKSELEKQVRTANKRVENLRKHYSDSDFFKKYQGGFKTKFKNKYEMREELVKASHFNNKMLSTLKGQKEFRKNTIEGLHKAGYDFVNYRNLNSFTRFMEDMRSANLTAGRGSDRIAKIYGYAKSKGVSYTKLKNDFEKWAKKYKEHERTV